MHSSDHDRCRSELYAVRDNAEEIISHEEAASVEHSYNVEYCNGHMIDALAPS